MKPPSFAYAAPETLSEALALKEEYGDEAKILAGGQSLIPMMNFRIAQPSVLIDISRVTGLDHIGAGDGSIKIGAMVRQTAVATSDEVCALLPIVTQAAPHIGHVATRARGTFVGSAAHADPVAEIPALLRALEAKVVATGAAGERVIEADDFFKGYFTTDLAADEIVTELSIPTTAGVRGAFLEVARRHGDFALVSVAAALSFEDAVVRSARVVIGGVADIPQRAVDAERSLEGNALNSAGAAEAGRLTSAEIRPGSDVHASARYRQLVAGVLVERALIQLIDDSPTARGA